MMTKNQTAQNIFKTCLNLPVPQREGYLNQACADDAELRELVNTHLSQAEQIESPSGKPQQAQTSMLGKKIGPYEIVGQIGVGGMGLIYEAKDPRLQRNIAIKCLPSHLSNEENYRQRFFNEARAVSQLEHPNVCSLFDIGETDDKQLYIAMPYYKGQTLERLLAGGTLAWPEIMNITLQIASGLQAAHAQGIIHRDIKPANVMLDQNNVVKLLDFGVAKVSGISMTSTGVGLGTVAYMSPEQLAGKQVVASSDLWALGNIIYEMIMGKRPFHGDQAATIIHSVLYADPPDLTLPADFPAELSRILGKLLARDVDDRYQTAQEFILDLSTLSAGGDMPNYIHSTPTTPQPVSARQTPAAISQQQLTEIVTEMTLHVGPIASILVPKFANTSPDLSTLCLRLYDYLPDSESRRAFKNRYASEMSSINTVTSLPQVAVPDKPAFTEAQLLCLGSMLINLIGPIATEIVKRYARQASSEDVLCDMLSQHIEDEQEKNDFIQQSKSCF